MPQPASKPLVSLPALRPATRADLPLIVAMRDELNALELAGCPHAPIRKLSVAEFAEAWGRTLDDSRYCWRMVEADGKAAGFGLIYLMGPPSPPGGAFVHWAYLHSAFRHLGLGRLLVEHLLAWAAEQGARWVELQFIEGNALAEDFWAAAGFQSYARKCVRRLS